MEFIKASNLVKQTTTNIAVVTRKVDGIRLMVDSENPRRIISRNRKVLPGMITALTEGAIEKIEEYKDCEVFKNDFYTTMSLLASHEPEKHVIDEDDIFPLLNSSMDQRLFICNTNNISKQFLKPLMEKEVENGWEGLVIRDGSRWYRYKPSHTADVRIIGYKEQLDIKKRPKNQLGGFNTNYGWVTGFKDVDRVALWDNPKQYLGSIMEVDYKEIGPHGKFRFVVKFVRLRPDKDNESL